ncbi:MAG: SRPBCC family protein [Moraxellaceae bacterium]|nr:SRPBCC family protein [Moraxellaceae bacterium]MDZ4385741.1 SRPBCC family protein [Moraxellaceae bacterium]
MHIIHTTPLRMALAANALFSLTCAGVMILFPATVGQWLGVNAPLLLQTLGAGLVLFAVDLLHQATRQRLATWRALYASLADLLWVVASVIVLVAFTQLFTPVGTALVVAIAAIVLLFGLLQLRGIALLHRLPVTCLYRHCITVQTDAPADAMWAIVARLDEIQRYMPSLKRSEVLDGLSPGLGAIRQCEDHGGKQWTEECIAFNAGRSFDVRFYTEAPDFPFPARTMVGGWEVLPTQSGSQVRVWWELTPKPAWLASVVLPLLAWQADRDFPKVIGRMAAQAQGKTMEGGSAGKVRLLPEFC